MTSQGITTPIRTSANLLRNTLYANAVFSALFGLDFLLFAGPITRFLGWSSPWVVPLLGVGLLGFAWFVYRTAKWKPLDRGAARAILAADVLWVVASILVLVTGWVPLTLGGKWAVALVADAVAVFAVLEVIGLRRFHD